MRSAQAALTATRHRRRKPTHAAAPALLVVGIEDGDHDLGTLLEGGSDGDVRRGVVAVVLAVHRAQISTSAQPGLALLGEGGSALT